MTKVELNDMINKLYLLAYEDGYADAESWAKVIDKLIILRDKTV
jgi:hypothetical protein